MQFKDEYRWLSNFADCEVILDGVTYPSVENAYQAAKTIDLPARELFLDVTAGKAKRLGKKIAIREDWESIKLEVMEGLLRQKFNTPKFKTLLLQTKDEQIIEGNTWGDTFWGVDIHSGKGKNHLGNIIMIIRRQLQVE